MARRRGRVTIDKHAPRHRLRLERGVRARTIVRHEHARFCRKGEMAGGFAASVGRAEHESSAKEIENCPICSWNFRPETVDLRSRREVYSDRLAGEIFGAGIGFACLRKRHRNLLGISLKQSPELLCLFADDASSTLPVQRASPAYCFETLDSSNKSVFTSATTRRGSSVPEL